MDQNDQIRQPKLFLATKMEQKKEQKYELELTENACEILEGEINGEPILSKDSIKEVRVFPIRVSYFHIRSILHCHIREANPSSILC